MQIDFHHAVTYVAARLAGFSHEEADIIAYAAQYVDDATSDGAVRFDNKAIYTRISSSHKTIDLQNLNPVDDLLVWMPFHFLPGNGGVPAGQNPDGTFIAKIVTMPDSPVAREMVQAAIVDNHQALRAPPTGHHHACLCRYLGASGICRGSAPDQ